MIPEPPPEYPATVLDRIRLQNFKTHRDTEIHLGRLTVLVGPNGAGKSSVLQAIELLPKLIRSTSPLDLSRKLVLLPWATRPQEEQAAGACTIRASGYLKQGMPWWIDTSRGDHQDKLTDRLLKELKVTSLELNAERLAEPVPISQEEPGLAKDGYGLAEVIAAMRDTDDDSFQDLQRAVSAVVPQIDRLAIRRVKPEAGVLAHMLAFDMSGRKGIPADMMSGGTLLSVGILGLLYSKARPDILLIDDIDHGLHPKAQWDLLKQLRRLLEQFPDLQIVATSHSPDLVDELDPSEVVVVALREDGTSAARPLTACPREDLLGVLKAGQLWSAIGEDWVKDAQPAEPTP